MGYSTSWDKVILFLPDRSSSPRHENVLKIQYFVLGLPAGKVGVRGVDHDKVYLVILEQRYAASGSSVGDFYADIGIFPVEPLKIRH